MKQGCHGGLVDPTAPKARFRVWVVSQGANILDPILVSGIEFHLHALLGDAFTASQGCNLGHSCAFLVPSNCHHGA